MCARLESREPATDVQQSSSGKTTKVMKKVTDDHAMHHSPRPKHGKPPSMVPSGNSDTCNAKTSDDSDINAGDSSSGGHCCGSHCVVVTSSLYCADFRGRTLTRAELPPRAASWHPCLRVPSPCAAQRKKGRCRHKAISPRTIVRPEPSSTSARRPNSDYLWRLKLMAAADHRLNGRYRTPMTAPVSRDQSAEDQSSTSACLPADAEKFRDKPLTMMLRNYPRNRSQKQLFTELQESALRDGFDFLYLPAADTMAKSSKGYAFVNFKTSELAYTFYELWHKTWYPTHMRQPMTVAPAELQGWNANIQRFFSSAQRKVKASLLPIVYDAHGNLMNLHDWSPRPTIARKKPHHKEMSKNKDVEHEKLRSV